ncbi:subclass B1 metallo-beta-lactamase [Lacibacter sp. MH-610]|uniref:subclass B1 metallo-beta-lactamase n=1 Tax=Lacibacter sp. MH-610 TaxID=3020883 RepID=UPI003891E6A6
MNLIHQSLFALLLTFISLNSNAQQQKTFQPKEVYKTDRLIITQISKNAFVHTSYKQTNDFGNVPCNGLVVRNGKETIVFDTPTNDSTSHELIQWIESSLHCQINAIIPTHFHDDCLGGLKAFDEHQIPSYAYFKTIDLARANNYTVPKNSFSDSVVLKLGNQYIVARFFGEGHTKDNIVGYFPSEQILFGGCLLKSVNASKGFLGDAVVTSWSATVQKIKNEYPHLKLVVPGHGSYGNQQLLDYTIKLFSGE